jgi:hypothetical protein
MRLLRLAIGIVALAFSIEAPALVRNFPQDIQAGELQGIDAPFVRISGKIYRMAPGIKFRGTNNIIVPPGSVRTTAKIVFTLDLMGQVWVVWMLTPEEIEVLAQRGYRWP